MFIYQPGLSKLLLGLEVISAFIALLYYSKLKTTHWKWLVYYLIFIGIQELYFFNNDHFYGIQKQNYYAFFGIPLEYIFLYWLYAVKSLKKEKLFWLFSILLLFTLLPIEFNKLINVVYSLTITVGSFLLMILVFLEFNKQIKDDNILEFKTKKMFYVNFGVLLFYVGSVPFMGLYSLFIKEPDLWNNYYIYYVSSNCLLYVFYIFSFICGKKN